MKGLLGVAGVGAGGGILRLQVRTCELLAKLRGMRSAWSFPLSLQVTAHVSA